jgi:hypothetical protein
MILKELQRVMSPGSGTVIHFLRWVIENGGKYITE